MKPAFDLGQLRVLEPVAPSRTWELEPLCGRLVEISGQGASAVTTAAVALVLQAQTADEPIAWISVGEEMFLPGDALDSGVDLAALVVVRVPDLQIAGRIADRLLGSGAFGLIVIDSLGCEPQLSTAAQGKLLTQAKTHAATVVCLTLKSVNQASLGSLISLHVTTTRSRAEPSGIAIRVHALKDKIGGPGWGEQIARDAPKGGCASRLV
jgi:RecA/RadA recombinase